MSDDEEDQAESNANLYEGSMDGADSLSFGPLVPTETERSLMERVRQELKHELKQVQLLRINKPSMRDIFLREIIVWCQITRFD